MMTVRTANLSFVVVMVFSMTCNASAVEVKEVPERWSVERANAWHNELPWLVGYNCYPATAISQSDMWQASTWDPKTTDRELRMAFRPA